MVPLYIDLATKQCGMTQLEAACTESAQAEKVTTHIYQGDTPSWAEMQRHCMARKPSHLLLDHGMRRDRGMVQADVHSG